MIFQPPDNKTILELFEQESSFKSSQLVQIIGCSWDQKVLEHVITTAYVIGFRDGGTTAFDKAQEILTRKEPANG